MLLCNSWSVTMVLCWMENASDVTEACLFCERKDPPQECNPTNCTWLLLTLECRCVQIMVTTVPIIVFFFILRGATGLQVFLRNCLTVFPVTQLSNSQL